MRDQLNSDELLLMKWCTVPRGMKQRSPTPIWRGCPSTVKVSIPSNPYNCRAEYGMYLLCQYYTHRDAARAAEYEYCLRDALRNGHRLVLFEEHQAPAD